MATSHRLSTAAWGIGEAIDERAADSATTATGQVISRPSSPLSCATSSRTDRPSAFVEATGSIRAWRSANQEWLSLVNRFSDDGCGMTTASSYRSTVASVGAPIVGLVACVLLIPASKRGVRSSRSGWDGVAAGPPPGPAPGDFTHPDVLTSYYSLTLMAIPTIKNHPPASGRTVSRGVVNTLHPARDPAPSPQRVGGYRC
jgi:hypothetical protein